MSGRSSIIYVSLSLLFVFSCGKNSEPTAPSDNEPPTFEQSGIIGESGGIVEISDSNNPLFGAYVKIPEGALKSNRTILIETVSEITTFEGDTSVIAVSLEPSGIQFEKPVEIGIPYKQNEDPNNLEVYFFSEQDSLWKKLPKVGLDSNTGVIIAQTIHFTKFIAENSKVEFDIELYKSNGKIAAGLKLLTPLLKIKTDLLTRITTLAGNFRRLVEDRPYRVNPVFIVKLKRKQPFSPWFDEELHEKTIIYSIYDILNGKPGAVSAFEVTKDQGGDVFNHIVDFPSQLRELSYDEVEAYFSGEPILFVFGENRSNTAEYYVEANLYYASKRDRIPPSGPTWGHGYHVSTFDKAKTFSQLPDAPDHDGDRIIDAYDEIQGSIPTANIISPGNGASFTEGETITFTGSGADTEDGNLGGNSLVWKSNHDGQIGAGATFTTSVLSAKTHIITLTVTDSDGNKASHAITIYVTAGNTPPIASFTVSPTSGTTETDFVFDASHSSDSEEATANLQVRWDWENDGTWDTGFSTSKTANHKYSSEGTKTIRMEVKDTGGLTNSTTRQVSVSSSNTPPIASFTVTPSSGNTQTIFQFDASSSSDNEDLFSQLRFSWDWENNGIWDIENSTNYQPTHQFVTTGTKTVKLQVRDTGRLTSFTEKIVSVTSDQNVLIEWAVTFGGNDNAGGFSVRETSDGGFIVAAAKQSDIWLIKTDSRGNESWNRTYGGGGPRSVYITTDGGFLVTGTVVGNSSGTFSNDIFLLKTDIAGNELWNKTFGGSGFEIGSYAQETVDGGFIVMGTTKSYGAGGFDAWLIKTDASGNEIWNKTFGDSGYDYLFFGQETNDGGFIMVGGFLLKTDALGNELWRSNMWGHSVQQVSDGGFIITGASSNLSSDLSLVKTDATGNEIWRKTFGGSGSDRGLSVYETTDGGFIITGETDSFGAGGDDLWLIKTDALGNELWNKTFGGSYDDDGWSVQETTDGGFIVTGATVPAEAVNYNVWLIKVKEQ